MTNEEIRQWKQRKISRCYTGSFEVRDRNQQPKNAKHAYIPTVVYYGIR
jgi:hypothetical protein